MSLIDKHSHRIPEGDYIHMCRLMKEMYKTRNQLLVKPDVVGEDFIMTSDASINATHGSEVQKLSVMPLKNTRSIPKTR